MFGVHCSRGWASERPDSVWDVADTEILIQLRWADMDINNHINNVQIARLFEESRVRSFAQWLSQPQVVPSMVLARQDIEFRAVLEYSIEPVRVCSRVTRLGRSSFAMGLTLFAPDGQVCAYAESTLVNLDGTGRPSPLTDAMRDTLAERLGEPLPFQRPN